MILYHGTSIDNLDSILKKGILPGYLSKNNNWENSFNYERCEYLTYITKLPIQYAVNASYEFGKGVILQLDIDNNLLFPDPRYFIETHTSLMWTNPKKWKEMTTGKSLKNLAIKNKNTPIDNQSNFCCLDIIPTKSIIKYMIIDFKQRKSMMDLLLQEISNRKYKVDDFIQHLMDDPDWKKKYTLSDIGLNLINCF